MEKSLTKRIALYASVGAKEVEKKKRKIERLEHLIAGIICTVNDLDEVKAIKIPISRAIEFELNCASVSFRRCRICGCNRVEYLDSLDCGQQCTYIYSDVNMQCRTYICGSCITKSKEDESMDIFECKKCCVCWCPKHKSDANRYCKC